MLVAAAGPASNIAQALIGALIIRSLASDGTGMFDLIVTSAVRINLLLAVFNLLPIPPLDGGNVLAGLLPGRAAAAFRGLGQFGFLILLGLMYTGVLGDIIIPPYVFLREMLLP
jgi:Zn-dependent protease